ncbi:hypothetical protein JN531_005305 [Flagellatimonas centrodinii]|uniref:hypothetical protein n=1 Tax=Flagellatimonas centrodinii TaxID=2806210 RepID=UPI001FEDA352|nr:hypothetical protein [Flagellatimonas centrodinii]ULQ47704.1 hypothetical protein JN531_005305 [Flagellatimonas centrodinii]
MNAVPASPALRAVSTFDLVVTAILAVPGLSHGFVALVSYLGVVTGLAAPIEPFSSFAMFLVNLAGVLGVCWNLAILRTRADLLIRYNIIARWAVAALIVYYVLAQGMSPVVLLFVISEIGGSLVEMRARRAR